MKIVYIDMQNVHKSTEDMWWIIDWQLFYDYLTEKIQPEKIVIFIGYIQRYKHFYNRLQNIWYTLNFKEVLVRPDGSIKGDVDIDIAIQAMKDIDKLSLAYIVTWDADYNTLIDEWQSRWKFWKLFVPRLEKTLYILRKSAGTKLQTLTDIRHKIQKQKDSPESES